MSFAKLDSKITSSSLWDQSDHVVRVWIAFLAEKDANGYVRTSYGSMRRICNVTDDEDGHKFDEAISILEAPDTESRTPDNEGRRIQRVEGGWIVLNHEKYRLSEDIIREQTRERVRKFREKNRNINQRNVTGALPSVSVSVSDSVSVSGIKEGVKGEKHQRNIIPPELEWVKKYCEERGNKIDPQGFFDHYVARNWIPKGYTRQMVDWQAAVRTWERHSITHEKKPQMTNYLSGRYSEI